MAKLRNIEAKNQVSPDSEIIAPDVKMYELHCKEAFTDLKEAMRHLSDGQEKLFAGQTLNATNIADLHATIKNGLTQRMDRLDRRLWIVLAAIVTAAIAFIISSIV